MSIGCNSDDKAVVEIKNIFLQCVDYVYAHFFVNPNAALALTEV